MSKFDGFYWTTALPKLISSLNPGLVVDVRFMNNIIQAGNQINKAIKTDPESESSRNSAATLSDASRNPKCAMSLDDFSLAVIDHIQQASNSTLSDAQSSSVHNALIPLYDELVRTKRLAEPGMGLNAWFECDEKGVSSKFLINYIHRPEKAEYGHPYDPDDFHRCQKAIAAVPGTSELFHKMVDASPAWRRLVEKWNEIEAAMELEGPEAYMLIQACVAD